jgi:hypothetical protein
VCRNLDSSKKLSPKILSFHRHSEEEMTKNSVTLRFIRNKNGSGSTDDVLYISPAAEVDSFIVKFVPTESFAIGDCEQKASWSREQVYDYVANLLTLLTFDSDPFASVQLDLPLAPSLLFDVSTLSERIPYVLRFLYTNLTNPWPTKPVKPVKPADPVDEYDDMPPLVPCEDELPCQHRSSRPSRSSRNPRYPRHTFYDNDGKEWYRC